MCGFGHMFDTSANKAKTTATCIDMSQFVFWGIEDNHVLLEEREESFEGSTAALCFDSEEIDGSHELMFLGGWRRSAVVRYCDIGEFVESE